MNNLKFKKTILLIAAFFTLSGATFAQKKLTLDFTLQPGMSYGGDYFYDYKNNKMFANSFTFNLKFGANLGYYLNENMGVSIGLLYDHLGQNYKDYPHYYNYYEITLQKSTSLNYLKFPMLFNYIFNPKEQLSFTFTTGFYLSFLLKYTDEIKEINIPEMQGNPNYPNYIVTEIASGSTFSHSTDPASLIDYKKENAFSNGNPFNSVDFGGIISAGILYNVSEKITIPVLLSYNLGFVNIKNTSSKVGSHLYWDSENNSTAYHNSSFGLQLGVRMKLP
jgi:hypothetical protein